MKIYDISMPVHSGMPVYKNREEMKPVFSVVQDFLSSDVHQTKVTLDLHTGTHLDTPLHMIENGDDIEYFNLEDVISKCTVLDLTGVDDKITETHLSGKNISSNEFVLLKTENSTRDDFTTDFVFLSETGAEYLARQNITGVGIDSLGIERNQPGHPTHKILLSKGIYIIEGLRLEDVPEGNYYLLMVPLNIKHADGVPVRVLLIDELKSFINSL
ncbi:cyclase family protein [Halothermothrix orenii]|nr:cyclase family protein [Halothermothrix orenii]